MINHPLYTLVIADKIFRSGEHENGYARFYYCWQKFDRGVRRSQLQMRRNSAVAFSPSGRSFRSVQSMENLLLLYVS